MYTCRYYLERRVERLERRRTRLCRAIDPVGDLPHDVWVYVCVRERDPSLPGD